MLFHLYYENTPTIDQRKVIEANVIDVLCGNISGFKKRGRNSNNGKVEVSEIVFNKILFKPIGGNEICYTSAN